MGEPLPSLPSLPPALPAEVERLLAETSVLKGVPLLPSDIANGMLFLSSDMARCVNVSGR